MRVIPDIAALTVLLSALLVMASSPAHAQLEEKMRELQRTQSQLKSSRAKHATLTGNIEKMERDMNSLAEEITHVATALQDNENEVTKLEQRMAELQEEREQGRAELAERKKHIGAMLSTLVRIGQIPKESAVLMPASFMDRLRTTRMLGMTTQGLRMEMDSLSLQLAELKRLEHRITDQRAEIENKTLALRKRQKELRGIIAQRKAMMQSLYSENRSQQKAIAALIGRSQDLQSLVNTLEKARKEQLDEQFRHIGLPVPKPALPGLGKAPSRVAQGEEVRTAAPSGQALPSMREAKGRLRMPVGGKVIASYGQRRGVNDTLKGVEVATRSSAQVVAPFEGEVLFTGPFRDYGNMVILRHSDNYHTLLAGMTELDCVPGQRVLQGEPVGVMGETIEARRLYLELRHGGKPTDPRPWIASFSSYLAQN